MISPLEEADELIESVSRDYPDAVRLARVVSLAARVEPELLRSARLTLLPEVDAGVEADLWFSPLVQADNPLALMLVPEVEDRLRRQLAQNQQLLNDAWNVLKRVHRDSPPAIRLEEEVTCLLLSDDPHAPMTICQLLEPVVSAIIQQEDRRGLAGWAARALPRLPEVTPDSEASKAIWRLAIAAGARLGDGKFSRAHRQRTLYAAGCSGSCRPTGHTLRLACGSSPTVLSSALWLCLARIRSRCRR